MRSRSSRLFIVLLHLVGVSTNLPRNIPYWNVGIIGVHPMAILLESLDLKIAGGLEELLSRLEAAGYNADEVLSEPYWLQDETDGKCLGPGGFSECGDATLWLIRRRPSKEVKSPSNRNDDGSEKVRKKDLRRVFSSCFPFIPLLDSPARDESGNDGWGYALQLVDAEMMSSSSSIPDVTEILKKHRRSRRVKQNEGECLLPRQRIPGKRREKDGNEQSSQGLSLSLGPCSTDEAWTWHIDGDGVLIQDRQILDSTDSMHLIGAGKVLLGGPMLHLMDNDAKALSHRQSRLETGSPRCVWRANSTSAAVDICKDMNTPKTGVTSSGTSTTVMPASFKEDGSRRVVSFSLVRYQSTATTTSPIPSLAGDVNELGDVIDGRAVTSSKQLRGSSENFSDQNESSTSAATRSEETNGETRQDHDHWHTTMTTSKSHATGPALHPDLKPASQLVFARLGQGGGKEEKSKKIKLPLSLLKESNPTLIVGGSTFSAGSGGGKASDRADVRDSRKRRLEKRSSKQSQHLLHHPHVAGGPQNVDSPHKTRKMPVHPYIKASKDCVWVDPETGLEYLTDLSGYLGHDRKRTGRHTLMGVGQYTRTVLKIKVYGIAFYVSKRDVLADPEFERFASLSSEELRARDDFYSHLMHMPAPDNPEAGLFDRTLLLKLNMQLSTDTMRSSLQADWRMLTDEHKDMLVSSSFKKRPADEAMLRKIQSEENSSNCSCGQYAPDEYDADPSCCARGTELVFTWRKNGDLEVRLDGRVIDIFPRPDVAAGIFYEYLRGDDPMSVDARDHFADGFPFLLAPLAQVKGISSPIRTQTVGTDTISKGHEEDNVRGPFWALGFMNAQASGFVSWVRAGANDMASNVAGAARSAGESARNFGDSWEKRSSAVLNQLTSLPGHGANFFSSRMPFMKQHGPVVSTVSNLLGDLGNLSGNEWELGRRNQSVHLSNLVPQSRVFHSSSRGIFGGSSPSAPLPDEIGPIIHPTMNFTHKLFLTMVHFYLMLLLIVSLPGTNGTRTKLIVRRTSGCSQKKDYHEESCSIVKAKSLGREKAANHSKEEKRRREESVMKRGLRTNEIHENSQTSSKIGAEVSDRSSGKVDRSGNRKSEARRENEERARIPIAQKQNMQKSLSYFL